MKKLNRKGFTLVELLAVIVILAIVVGITLVTVLPTLDKAKEKAFSTAVDTIKNYLQEQVDMKGIGETFGDNGYIPALANATCTSTVRCTATQYNDGETMTNFAGDVNVLELTGYSENIKTIEWYITNGKVTVHCANPMPGGDYEQGAITECPQ